MSVKTRTRFVGGSGSFNPQVFIDPHWFSQKYIADPPLVFSTNRVLVKMDEESIVSLKYSIGSESDMKRED